MLQIAPQMRILVALEGSVAKFESAELVG